jgi:hypothetical protein
MERRKEITKWYKNNAIQSNVPYEMYRRLTSSIKHCVKSISPMKQKMENEKRVFNKLMYKNKNQHKSSIPYRKLKHVERILDRIMELEPFLFIISLQRMSQFDVDFLTEYFDSFLELIKRLRQEIESTFVILNQSIAITYFMALYLTLNSILGRLYWISGVLLDAVDPLALVFKVKTLAVEESEKVIKNVEEPQELDKKQDKELDDDDVMMDWCTNIQNTIRDEIDDIFG